MEVVARLMMILVGFIIVMLGFITFIHSGEHRMLGLLICFAGVVSMFAGLPSVEENNSRLDESFKRNKKQMEFDFDK
jgi:p-aminobenzoyl-glutamate transporter AbgT